eukprot:TRINITY_DN17125_c0_g1_i1.p1 TRINITY_DN17125_c0_g1~~TRINITY_DN17125_c0_g1_i1.p1  ORF type:complete len:316 (-),score=95.96 TRINITY_DN17125_c0_g1_i1:51-998(-)
MPATDATLDVVEVLSVCIDAAERAGEIIRQVWKSGDLQIKDKGGDDPMTQADIKAQQLIIGMLTKIWPDIHLVGEEECESPVTDDTPDGNRALIAEKLPAPVPESLRKVPFNDVCVFIDPLDATKEFTLGNVEAVVTLIGVAVAGKAVAGVMYQPFVDNGITMWGIEGVGCVGVPIVSPTTAGVEGKLVLATTRSHSNSIVVESLEVIKPDEILRKGGSGFKALLVLNSLADVYMYPTIGTKLWDTCAPEALLRASGGTLTNALGERLEYLPTTDVQNRRGVLAAMSLSVHADVVARIQPVKQSILIAEAKSKGK